MALRLRGRRLLVTGASRGIGRCLAEQAAQAGAAVAVVARTAEQLDALAAPSALHGAKIIPIAADITVPEDRRRVIETMHQALGGLDVLVNNAGVGSFGHFSDSSEAVLRQVMEVNFFAPAELIRLALPMLKDGRQPAIINIASKCGRRALPAWAEYSASKFALCGLSDALRAELARYEIHVLVVLPGLTNTGLGMRLIRNEGRMKIDFAKGMPAEDVARRTLQALLARRSEVVVGKDARWLLRLQRFCPRLLDRLMARKVRQLYAAEIRQRDWEIRARAATKLKPDG